MGSTLHRSSPSKSQARAMFLLPLVLLLFTCSGRPGVLVDIGTWPEPADSIRVDGVLDGVKFTEPLSFAGRQTRFVVYLAEGNSGQLSLALTAVDGEGCPRATGEAQVAIGSGLRRVAEANVAMVAVAAPYCPAPQVDGIVPSSGVNYSPTMITLAGRGFRAGASVSVGGKPCAPVSVVSSTQITCVVPGRAGTCGPQAVAVTNNDSQTASGSLFFYRSTSLSFTPPASLTGSGTVPRQLIAADFNSDGKLDLASVNFSSSNVSIYLNDGMGGFGAATNFAVGSGPVGLAVGDLNKDNKLDLVVTNVNGNSISFLAGNGLGGFNAAINTTGFSSPQGVAIGDVSNDGSADVLVTNLGTSDVAVLIGNGMGGLTPLAPVKVGTAPRYLALADMNKDGNLDLVVPNISSNNVSYRPGLGNARFGPGVDIAVGMTPIQVVVHDVNHDQIPDIVVANQDSSNVSVLLGMGAETFTPAAGSPFAVGTGPNGLSLADMDGDGNIDILTANFNAANVSILAGNGTGGFLSFVASPFSTALNAFGIATGDFNGDGLMDFASANSGVNNTVIRVAQCN